MRCAPSDLPAYQRPLAYDRSEPVQVEALKNHKSDHAGPLVLVYRAGRPLWVHEADGGVGAGVPLEAAHWSVIHPGDRRGKRRSPNPCRLLPRSFPSLSNCGLPNDDIVAVDVRSEVASVKDPSAAHHHAPPASATAAQGGRQAGLGQGGQSLGQMSLTALKPQGRGQVRGHQPVLLRKHGDVKETR